MKKRKKQLRRHVVFVVIFAVILGIVIWPADDAVDRGIAYVKGQEQKSTTAISKKLTKKRSQELNDAYKEGKINVYSFFTDYAFFGDSRVVGFSNMGVLDRARVMAGAGHTVKNITDWKKQIKGLRPSHLYFSYGVNDMGLDIDGQYNGYDRYYASQIKQILKYCPDGTTVTVCSIIPATAAAAAKSPAWNQVDKYNAKIKKMCKENAWTYVDNTEICDDGQADIYEADGVHFHASFYPVWAKNILGL
ncbi:GDSL-type esterase/lipase family protein [Catenisphaera adipataccumulans]|uniref:SGNH hydrolase-type esterase domain-containing protein n=1 Tax=Catenisphaera adipataccumulans TaxID=700500 RepID=A0A7W8FXQ1_9FIRM|nr:GDSL-type esterase/lipase family protein [Catenisphaera adipataccumulans]MBB5183202.1 hypothetical protein [Catenisphaera adipataccumulans]